MTEVRELMRMETINGFVSRVAKNIFKHDQFQGNVRDIARQILKSDALKMYVRQEVHRAVTELQSEEK